MTGYELTIDDIELRVTLITLVNEDAARTATLAAFTGVEEADMGTHTSLPLRIPFVYRP